MLPPMEMSRPPVIMTRVRVPATMPLKEMLVSMVEMFWNE